MNSTTDTGAARYQIVHRTEYGFSDWIDGCQVQARLRPRSTAVARCDESHVAVIPLPAERATGTDEFGNEVETLYIRRRLRRLVVSSSALVSVPGWASQNLATAADLPAEDPLLPGLEVRAACRAYGADLFDTSPISPATIAALAGRLHRDLVFDPSMLAVGRPIAAILSDRRGLCQDYARLAVACLRAYAIPARCIVGYVLPGQRGHRPGHASFRLPHAWFGAFLPDHGWLEFDPTEPGLQADDLITLAWGASEADVTPVQGRLGTPSETQLLQVHITVDQVR